MALAATVVTAVKPIEIKGNEFYVADTGKRFQMVGVGYQPGGSAGYKSEEGEDPLTNADACMRDAALMQVLGINTVRVYNLNPDLNHDECVSIFNAVGASYSPISNYSNPDKLIQISRLVCTW